MYCDLCNLENYTVRRFTTRDKETNNNTGSICLCKECVEHYEDLYDEVVCEEE